jgi:AcrR family transcriptional regulator
VAKQARGEATVARVLDAALLCFSEAGGRATSVQEVAERSGVSIGSLYHHFGSWDGVERALYQRTLTALLACVSARFLRARTARGALRALVDAYLDWVEENPEAARFLYRLPPARLEEGAALDGFKGPLLAPLFERAAGFVAAGQLRRIEPQYFEIIVIGPVAELSRRWLAGSPGLELRKSRAVVAELIWAALAPDRA